MSACSAAAAVLLVLGWLFLSPDSRTPLALPQLLQRNHVGIDVDQVKCTGGWLHVAAEGSLGVGVVIGEIEIVPGLAPAQPAPNEPVVYLSAWTCASRSVVLLLESTKVEASDEKSLESALGAASTATIVTDVDVLHKTTPGLGVGPHIPDETQAPDLGRIAIPYTTRISAGQHSYSGSCRVLEPSQTAALFGSASGLPACKHISVAAAALNREHSIAVGSLLRRAAAQAKASHLLIGAASSPPLENKAAGSISVPVTRLTPSEADDSELAAYSTIEAADCALAFWLASSSSSSSWLGAAASGTAPATAVASPPPRGCTGVLRHPGFSQGVTPVTVPVLLPGKTFSTAPLTVMTTIAVLDASAASGASVGLPASAELAAELHQAAQSAARLAASSPGSHQASAGWRVMGHLVQTALSTEEAEALSAAEAEEIEAAQAARARTEAEAASRIPASIAQSAHGDGHRRMVEALRAELSRLAQASTGADTTPPGPAGADTTPPGPGSEEQPPPGEHEPGAQADVGVVVIIRTVLAGHSVQDPTALHEALHGGEARADAQAIRVYSSGSGSAVVLGGGLVPLSLGDAVDASTTTALAVHDGAAPSPGSEEPTTSSVLAGLAASRPDALGGDTTPRIFLHESLADGCGGPRFCIANGCRAAFSVGRAVALAEASGLCPALHDGLAAIEFLARRPVDSQEAAQDAAGGGAAEPRQCRPPVAALALHVLEFAETCHAAAGAHAAAVEAAGSSAAALGALPSHPWRQSAELVGVVSERLGRAARLCAQGHKHGVAHEEAMGKQRRREEAAEEGGGRLRGLVSGLGDDAPATEKGALARDLVVPAASHLQSVFEQCAALGARSVGGNAPGAGDLAGFAAWAEAADRAFELRVQALALRFADSARPRVFSP